MASYPARKQLEASYALTKRQGMSTREIKKSIRKQVLLLLKNNGKRAFRAKEIAKTLGYSDSRRYNLFRKVLSELESSQNIEVVKGRRFKHKSKRQQHVVTGYLTVNPQGFGFVQIDGHDEDVYIPAGGMRTALHGDTVEIEIGARSRGKKEQPEGRVLRVIERARAEVVGTFDLMGHFAFVAPDNPRITKDIYIPKDGFNNAKQGDKVVASIDIYDDPKAAPEGRILDVIGPSGAPGVAVLAIAMASGAKPEFPEEVESQARQINTEITSAEIERRRDLREYPIFTVDPADAKDFDDAIHIIEKESGDFEIGIHIADVSHYVEEHSAIDSEALGRATSTYLVDRVIPMLPETLSNNVCSLRPNEDKLTYSCLLTVSPEGAVLDYDIAETVIHSKARLTYEEAQNIIDGTLTHPMEDDILRAASLSQMLTDLRMANGAIDFNLAEVRVELNEHDEPVQAYEVERKRSNRLIEEFMLLANRTIAQHIGSRSRPNPFVYRVHAPPDQDRIENLSTYARAFGYSLPHSKGTVSSIDLNALLEAARGSSRQFIIETAALQSMSKAIYSTENIGHFGLGFEYYSHFTSPIRRYPDLLVHRLLKTYNSGNSASEIDGDVLANHCKHCSERERAATEAERESTQLKLVEYAKKFEGETFEGTVVGVTRFGIFVKMHKLLAEGLVHVRDMTNDFWEHDPKQFALIGSHTGRRIQLGDSVRVKLAAASVESRRIDLLLSD